MTEHARAPAGAVAAALQDVAALGGFFVLHVGGPDEGWHPLDHSYARGFTDLAEAVEHRHHTREPRIGVSIAHLGHAARLWSPTLACVLLHGIVPDLTELQRADDGPALRLPHAAGWYTERLPEPTSALNAQVMRHLWGLAAGLRIKIAPRLLDGNAASALVGAAHALLAARPGLRKPLTSLTTELLSTGGLAGTGVITGPDLTFRRRSCCLYYRAPKGSKCGDCCLAGRDGP
ncbi:(2Fe-2S)-binding protein [Streptomyces hirsutus]|uniref:(2Fe-2S)-binding protein n=1 Tax=Streptomyces hirsutus TaxID=35620 RepID=A0ABZ1GWF6_9ACTN|nr:(2Fe-2S)-binding protein [Streptomyces hirsutus]WSD10455.1 (2Fe-2S)-binding protein [Streptomyces hirsutus]WTD16199.1 (2Fe-2S)-binding protein [Streptomyces hirsutus]WTD79028.1 (2Fe-2S)-binding protein [Streptomyces sp. NBC_01635]